MTLLDATAIRDEFGDPVIRGILRIQLRIDAALGRMYEADRQLWFLATHATLLTDKPVAQNPRTRRENAVSRVTHIWLRRETENPEAMRSDIEALAVLGRTERWKTAIRTWALVALVDPDMFHQQSTYVHYAAE